MEPISSIQNARIKAWRKLFKKRERDRSGLFLVEGVHLVEEALKAPVNVKVIVLVEGKDIPEQWKVKNTEIVYVTERVLQELSETETPQGMIAVCEQPELKNIVFDQGKYVLLDNIQDPGNLGSILRTAEAAGIQGVIFGEGCADPYNGKVVRATQGALFHISVQRMDLSEAVDLCKENNIPVFGTSLSGSTYSAIAPQDSFALILGNEGAGVHHDLLHKADQNLYIPIYGQSESLNVSVAAGILIYHLRGD
ncbi:TrmH family RNA methyltransferase [Alkalicoccus daliensis]|uniref:RNA methyltransferase, TrmH family n=1 Tax=Alkalicoccus daliensis TaxID=745820 RepID=A0A1H0CFG0_9BACI|nr:RNA methyltransferase [Alkalicoccus daliensis]SDN56600.1 RNA methyltransferase, TrmH family [Alkalicoccus daliensis]